MFRLQLILALAIAWSSASNAYSADDYYDECVQNLNEISTTVIQNTTDRTFGEVLERMWHLIGVEPYSINDAISPSMRRGPADERVYVPSDEAIHNICDYDKNYYDDYIGRYISSYGFDDNGANISEYMRIVFPTTEQEKARLGSGWITKFMPENSPLRQALDDTLKPMFVSYTYRGNGPNLSEDFVCMVEYHMFPYQGSIRNHRNFQTTSDYLDLPFETVDEEVYTWSTKVWGYDLIRIYPQSDSLRGYDILFAQSRDEAMEDIKSLISEHSDLWNDTFDWEGFKNDLETGSLYSWGDEYDSGLRFHFIDMVKLKKFGSKMERSDVPWIERPKCQDALDEAREAYIRGDSPPPW